MEKNFIPLIIIGAPRSGTNSLRDCLTSLTGYCTWNCDEINYIWRYGNRDYPYDNLPIKLLTDEKKYYVRKKFYQLLQKNKNAKVIVEKTCANSLRVDYVHEIMPKSRFIYIKRDPIDVVASSIKRWKAKLEPFYIAKKSIHIPREDVFFYAKEYLINRIKRNLSKDKTLPSWGPRFPTIDEIRRNNCSIIDLCVYQWFYCNHYAQKSLSKLKNQGVLVSAVDYEIFVDDPLETLSKALNTIEIDYDKNELRKATKSIYKTSIGKGKSLTIQEKLKIKELLQTLNQ